jgi:transcriptional regulator with GAF, ATPase, and Fis domain
MAKLVVVEGPDRGSEFDLPTGDQQETGVLISVGRDPRATVPLSDPSVSREHFRLEALVRGFRLVDLGSRNLTYLNGDPTKDDFLQDGDVIRIGDTDLRFEGDRQALHSDGVVSTIIKAIPALGNGSFVERLGDFERHLGEERNQQALQSIQKLFDLYGQISATASVSELFQKLLATMAPALSADLVAVLRLQNDRWVLETKYPDEATSKALFSTTVVEKVASDRQAVLSAQTQLDERFREQASVVGEEIATAMAAPVSIEGATTCVLYADRRGARPPFEESDLQLLAAAAEPVGPILERLTEQDRLRSENRTLLRTLTDDKKIIGTSEPIRRVFEFVEKAAPTHMTVLIQGETGTGKELVASAVHYASPRRHQPFVALNCAALPENLAESELFGHERGAFTGAVSRRKGRFELADTGTVFLDEVGDLSLACQAKLLRLIEERKFERVGGTEPIQVDVRILAATNRDLLQGVQDGIFREDLYYRLNVLNVRLPPLRERREDLPLLVDHFLENTCNKAKRLGATARKKIEQYDWPGNVRQLRNAIESAVVLGGGTQIRAEDIVLPLVHATRSSSGGGGAEDEWEPCSLSALEKQHIARVLTHTGGNKKKAAEILGIERCTLYSKIKTYEIPT